MPTIDPAQRLALATAVAVEAGALALRYFRNLERLAVEHKGAQDLVSEADRAVERLIRARLSELCRGEPVLGEEGGADPGDLAAGCWVVDPIDGTWCFLNGIRSWCVSIAYARRGRIEAGVVVDPCAGEVFQARSGGGARLDGRPIRVKDAARLDEGSLSVGCSRRTSPEEIAPLIDALLRRDGLYHRHGSGALGLAWTACGRLIGYVEPHMHPWDCLAGLLLVEEAGGWTNDFLAGDGLTEGNPVLAGGHRLKPHLLALTEHWGGRRVGS
ncbi:MAG: inositol monophosphatase [Geminicoccaceae bacterium]|nr:inositol monophosphatase [Geminicoccaceae bacterium]